MALSIREGNPSKPSRILIYGLEGVGKSTFGAKADKPIFITPEGGVDQLTEADGVTRSKEISGIDSWDKVRESVKALVLEKHPFQTLVLDSADWIEKLCHAKIIGQSGKSITTVNGGYGAGYRSAETLHKELIDDLATLRDKKNMNIVITAHAHVRQVKDPSMLEDYDSFEIKCHDYVSSLWREWVDALFFVRFFTTIKTDEQGNAKARAFSDGKRVLYARKQPSFQAKNRYGMDTDGSGYVFTEGFWNQFKEMRAAAAQAGISTAQDSIDDVIKEINDRWEKITDESLKKTVQETVFKAMPEDSAPDMSVLIAVRKRLREIQGAA